MLAAEVRPRKGPSGLDLTNPVLRALDSRQPCVQIGSALAGIQVPPLPLLRMVVHRGGLATLRTRPAGLGRLLDPHVHPFGRHIQVAPPAPPSPPPASTEPRTTRCLSLLLPFPEWDVREAQLHCFPLGAGCAKLSGGRGGG